LITSVTTNIQNSSNKNVNYLITKANGGVDVEIHIFLTSALVGGEWSASRPGRFIPGERVPGNHWIGGWVDPRAGLHEVEKRKFFTLPGLKLLPLDRLARSQSYKNVSIDIMTIVTSSWEQGQGYINTPQIMNKSQHNEDYGINRCHILL
jgi:hypothetical protein